MVLRFFSWCFLSTAFVSSRLAGVCMSWANGAMACARRFEMLTQSQRKGSTCWSVEEREREWWESSDRGTYVCKLKTSRLARKRKKRDREKQNESRTSKEAYIVAY